MARHTINTSLDWLGKNGRGRNRDIFQLFPENSRPSLQASRCRVKVLAFLVFSTARMRGIGTRGWLAGSRSWWVESVAPATRPVCLAFICLGHWHEGTTAEDIASLVWGHPVLIARAAFTEWAAVSCATHACYI
jgi:hypothetical protein